MPLSWNEIKHRAIKFGNDWKTETREAAERQTFWNELFDIFGIKRRTVATKCGQNADQRREEKNLSPFLPPPCTVEEVEAHLRAAAFAGRVRLAPDQIPDCATAYISKRDLTDWKRGEIPITAAKWKSDSINFAVSYSANHPAQPGTDKDPYSNLEEL